MPDNIETTGGVPDRGHGFPAHLLSRRDLLRDGSLLAAAVALGVDLASCSSSKPSAKPPAGPAAAAHRVLSEHEHAVVEAATARLIPGPHDDPAEEGHPGAREAHVADYIDITLGALGDSPPRVWAGGPFSNRAGSRTDDMATFLTLSPTVQAHWEVRLRGLQANYRAGIAALDQEAAPTVGQPDFTKASPAQQDDILAKNPPVPNLPRGTKGFTDLLFQHSVEGCYAVPEYGGNADLSGWHEITFPGDTQPRGYPAEKVSHSDGPDPYTPTPLVAKVLTVFTATAPGSPATPSIVGQGIQH